MTNTETYYWGFLVMLATTMALADWFIYIDLRRQLAGVSRKWASELVNREIRDNGRLSLLENAQIRIDERQRELEARLDILVDRQQTIRLRIEERPAVKE